ncbi:MAG: hypothetical protein F4X98_14210 [Gammaproteobacteria bacterium]|nr:hypothetical protein [Gammaproteobacteria bacterium]
MIPLGFCSICLRTDRLGERVAFYRRLGFEPSGEDAPGLRVSLANGSDVLTFMTFLKQNVINFRGGHIHELMTRLRALGIRVTGHNEHPEEQPLMLDASGQPRPDNECGHFTVRDPDGHELFFNTHPHERQPFESALAGVAVGSDRVEGPFLGRFVYCLEVRNLARSVEFYTTLGMRTVCNDHGTWIAPVGHRAIQFALQLREAADAGSVLRFYGATTNNAALRECGFTRHGAAWRADDPEGHRLEVLPVSLLPDV